MVKCEFNSSIFNLEKCQEPSCDGCPFKPGKKTGESK
ncbi:hypothetical protein LCGC14_1233630 [marine sediment metagenome]|uniref:Uncharacterized protein n=1 Tax=marine sediment metagenome TaxID=412755 RepID=A0A0F9LBY9_9ZZZZ